MKNTFKFLRSLEQNNNRKWFQQNKEMYEKSHQEMVGFADRLLAEMNSHDFIETPSGKKSLFRIYRDVRFSKDKTPYKTNWGGSVKRAGVENRGGYYYQIGLTGSFVMGGFFGPSKDDLLHIRRHIEQDGDSLRHIIDSKDFKEFFGSLRGSQLKTAPRGFDKYHFDIDLLRYKQFIIRHDFSNEEVNSKDFPHFVSEAFQQMRPFFNWMSDLLITDLNGRYLV